MPDYIPNAYPTKGITDPSILMQSLGSFWNLLFSEKGTLKGYTLGQAEQMIQHYYNLVETINSYSASNIPVFHKEKWYPLIVKKSQFNSVPLKFAQNDAIFGPQQDTVYKDIVFKFGFPKTTNVKIYGLSVPAELTDFSLIADKVIKPDNLLFNNTDVVMTNNVLYFNKNIFTELNLPMAELVGENGVVQTFVDTDGTTQPDQITILWFYHADISQDNVFNNFGYIFDLKMDDTQMYKEVISALMTLHTQGPSITYIKALAAAFIGVSPVIAVKEIVENILTYPDKIKIVTDKNVYSFDSYYNILPGIAVGTTVYAGDILVDALEFYDNCSSRRWWDNKIVPKAALAGSVTKELSLPPYMFAGNYQHSFIFKNDLELFTADIHGNLFFPVEGDPQEVIKFNQYLTAHGAAIKSAVGLANGGAVVVNPLDFIFDNFLKQGTALIKLNFKTVAQAYQFTVFFDIIKTTLPKHVFYIFFFDFSLDNEEYNTLNGKTYLLSYCRTTAMLGNADGSDETGYIDDVSPEQTYKMDVGSDLFSLAINYGPGNTIDHFVQCNSIAPDVSILAVKAGDIGTTISPGDSNKQVPSLLFLDFSQ